MKDRLNITIDQELLEKAKRYASKHNTSISQLVEIYFRSLARPAHKKSILDMLKDKPGPKKAIDPGYIKDSYYQQRKKKYGF